MKKVLVLCMNFVISSSIYCMEQEKSDSAQKEQPKKVYVLKLTNYLTQEIKNALEPMGVKFLVLEDKKQKFKYCHGPVVAKNYFVKIEEKLVKTIKELSFVKNLTPHSMETKLRTDSKKTNFNLDSEYSDKTSRFLIQFFEEDEAEKFENAMRGHMFYFSHELAFLPYEDQILGYTYPFHCLNVVLTDNEQGRRLFLNMLSTPGIREVWEFDFNKERA